MRLAPCKWFALVGLMILIGLTQFANPTYAAVGGSTAKLSNDEAAERITTISKKLEEPGLRGQHSKGHGVVWAEFTVESSLPEDLKVGVFKEPGKTFSSWIRFSNAADKDDTQNGLHGIAIKLMRVEGTRSLEGVMHF